MIKAIVFALLATLFIGCSVRVLNFDENSTIKREYDVLSHEVNGK